MAGKPVRRQYWQTLSGIILMCLLVSSCSPSSTDDSWDATVKLVSSGVVSIQMDVPVSFDGKWNSSSYATGFIVDAKRGIILTNRHVVTPGPITAKAILINDEEIDLTPLYFDPVHDFGFYRYDPKQIKYLKPHEFVLSARGPSVGQNIRIIGNDAGQKISILDGTIARLDRAAPNYGKGNYNDFNTFYIQAATSSTGGSSGSPVVNIRGEAVALNAGSQSKSANSFFVPLDKIRLALGSLQQNQDIPRGTMQTTFESTAYPELKRLGLTEDLEQQYRGKFPQASGLLVIQSIIPGSEAAQNLAVGDILLAINEAALVDFSSLERQLNARVNNTVKVEVLRRGAPLTFDIKVTNLYDITPATFVKFDGGVYHNLSYQQARHFNKPLTGVYVANVGNAFKQSGLPNRSVITEFNGVVVDNVEAFNAQLRTLQDGIKVNLRYYDFNTTSGTNYALVEINRTWFEHSYCVKDKQSGFWPCEPVSLELAEPSQAQQTAEPASAAPASTAPVSTAPASTAPLTDDVANALVNVSFTSPYSIQGRSGSNSRYGTGMIVDAKRGWVVVPRSIVFSMLGDVKLTFNNRLEIPAAVEYVHPLHNVVLLSYDPALLKNIAVAQITLSDTTLVAGDAVLQIGLNYDGVVEYRQTEVDTVDELWLRQFEVPQYVDRNLKGIFLVNPNNAIDGILVNEQFEVTALWSSFEHSDNEGKESNSSMVGMSADYVRDLIALAQSKKPVYSLDLSLTLIAPVNALQMGLSEAWLDKIIEENPAANKLLTVVNVAASSANANLLKRGDILLAINGVPVSTFRQVEQLSQQAEVELTFLTEGKVQTAAVKTTELDGKDIEQVLFWSGLYLHAPHRAAQLQGNFSADGIYVSSYSHGSPATRYGLYAVQRIVEVDGQVVGSMDDFIQAVLNKQHQESVLIKTLDINDKPKITTLRMDNNYWPFYEVRYENGKWQKFDHILSGQDNHAGP
jgi:pro-apoptotic serine protease NMA111